ncbi:MAG: ImmA/IrrE family metallo-endopeptidase [Candidatus Krumholzibacteriota bacterium]|nr:ImmA/IrrE family metallo-endopeptidase [Candidatus Krumholzibacteriota bacterium]
MPNVNPNIIKWARETSKLSINEAVEKLGIKDARGVSAEDRLKALESGAENPSRPMLKKMAKAYHRPLVVFYMSSPPRKGDRGEDFRSLPDVYSEFEDALLDVLIRDIKARQSIVRAILEDEEDISPLQYVGASKISDGRASLLEMVESVLEFDKQEFRKQKGPEQAFNLLREKAENAGLFVLLIGNLGSYHTAINLELFRGFSLADDLAPFIVINDQDAYAAWTFTLIHELVHILLGQTGVSGAKTDNRIEKFCDDVAGEFLLSDEEISAITISDDWPIEDTIQMIGRFAYEHNVSSTMVAYKLFRSDRISYERWERLRHEFRSLWQKSKETRRIKARQSKDGPSYYVVKQHRVGKALINFIGNMIDAGMITSTKASKVLGVKAKNVQPLIEAVRFS